MRTYLLIALGGALGSMARFATQGFVDRHFRGQSEVPFPWGTLTVNGVGCLAIGILGGFFATPRSPSERVWLFFAVGGLGGFTTFSTFGLDTFRLLEAGRLKLALANIGLSVALGLVAVAVGYRSSTEFLAKS